MSVAWFLAAAASCVFAVHADAPALVRALLMSVNNSVTYALFSWKLQLAAGPPGADVAAAFPAGVEVAPPPARVGVTGVEEAERVAVAVTRLTGICRT